MEANGPYEMDDPYQGMKEELADPTYPVTPTYLHAKARPGKVGSVMDKLPLSNKSLTTLEIDDELAHSGRVA